MTNILFIIFLFLTFFTPLVSAQSSSKLSFDEELSQFSYPFEVQTFALESQNQSLSMRYMDIGDQNSEKVIVLLHGKNFSGYYW